MRQVLRSVRKMALCLPVLALWSCAAVSQPTPAPATAPAPAQVDGKAVAEKLIRPNKGTVALVFDENGKAVAVSRDGQLIPACQVCTPELERKYGPRCEKAKKAVEPGSLKTPSVTEPGPAPICNKLTGTNVLGIKPISVLRHTGSECITFFFDNGGDAEAFEYCW